MFPSARSKLEQQIHENHVKGVKLKGMISELEVTERTLEARNRKLRKELLSKFHAPQHLLMYDSVDVSTVPHNAMAVAGYVAGNWPDYLELVRRFPRAFHVPIAVTAGEDAECLDIEKGDASPWQAPFWVRRQHHRGITRPKLYADLSTMPEVKAALISHGIQRNEVLLWVAHYDGIAEIPKGYDAKQYDDKALGRNLDVSICTIDFFH